MTGAVDPYVPGRGNPGYEVEAYDLDLDLRLATDHLVGRARVSVRATDDLARLTLDLEGRLRASRVRVGGRPARWQQHHAKLDVTPPAPLTPGDEVDVEVAYAGRPGPAASTWGPVGWEELEDGVLAANQPSGAPTWFPCNDLPASKAPFRIAVTVDAGYLAVANGTLVSSARRGGRVRRVYEQTEPMAPYLATLHVGRYDELPIPASAVPTKLVAPRARAAAVQQAFARQPAMLEAFVERFGPYPFASGYTVVVTDDPLEIPLEATGLSTFGSNHLEQRWERLIAHELAHSWFGNSVTASAWRHIWLHEGFACYAEWIWSEASGGDPAAAHAAHHHARLSALPQDLLLGDPGPADMFDDRLYKRGALTLHAVRLELGDERFWQLLRTWTDRFAHGSAGTGDFTALADEVAGRSLREVLDRWLWDTGLPPL